MRRRVPIRAILADPVQRRDLCVGFIMAMQEHEGRERDRAAAERAYDAIHNDPAEQQRLADGLLEVCARNPEIYDTDG